MKNLYKVVTIGVIFSLMLLFVRDSIGLQYEGKKIKSIVVKGIQNTDDSLVYDALTFEEGDSLNAKELGQSIRNIYKTAKYKDVKVDVVEKKNQLIVTFIVEERPVIKEIVFKGIDEFGETDLSEAIKDYVAVDEVLDDYKINESVNIILDKYNEDGFNDTTIRTFKIIDKKEKTCKIIFKIKEGDEIRVEKIKIIGTKAYEEKKIIGVMDTHIDDWLHSGIFNRDEYAMDKRNIVRFYNNNGYIKAKILEDKLIYRIEGDKRDKEKKLYITIKIKEGHQYKFGGYQVAGYTLFSDEEIGELCELEKGGIFSQEEFGEDLQRIQALYSERGYIFSSIIPKEKIDDELKVISYDIQIVEGEIAHIEDIIVKGNTKTKDYVILRELLVKEGEIFNASKIRRSQEKIYNLGFFKNVTLDIKRGSAEGLMNLIIGIEEQMTGLITLGVVYGTVDGFGGYEEISENNLFGRGIRIHERIEFQQNKQNYEVGMSHPWIFGTPTTFSFSLFYRNKKEIRTPSIASNQEVYYNKQEWGVTVGLARRMTDYVTLSSLYGIELYKYYDFRPKSPGTSEIPSNSSLDEKRNKGNLVKSSITLRFDYDSRDNVFNPTRGLHFNQSWTIVGGPLQGNDKYNKYITDVSKYYPLFWKFVMVLHFNYGLIDRSFDGKSIDDTINSDDLLFVGGVESIRGYSYWDYQWRDGGFSRIYANLEYRFPIAEQIIWGVMFVDGGNLWEKSHHANFNIKEYYFSAGWGFRIQIPMIPIRLYFSKKFNYHDRKKRWMVGDNGAWQFDFSVGGLF